MRRKLLIASAFVFLMAPLAQAAAPVAAKKAMETTEAQKAKRMKRVRQIADKLKDPKEMRGAVAELLSPTAASEDLEVLLKEKGISEKPEMRGMVISLISKKDPRRAKPLLVQELDATVALGEDHRTNLIAAFADLEKGDREAIEICEKEYLQTEGSKRHRSAAALAAYRLGSKADSKGVLEIIEMSNSSSDVTSQFLAAESLVELNDPATLPRLKEMKKSKNVWTRIAANSAYNRIKLSNATNGASRMEALDEASRSQESESRQWAIKMMALETQDSEKLFKKIINDRKHPARREAKAYLDYLKEKEAKDGDGHGH